MEHLGPVFETPREQLTSPEALHVASVVRAVEADFAEHGIGGSRSDAQQRRNLCADFSYAVKAYCELAGMPADAYHTLGLHSGISGVFNIADVFGHVYTIVYPGDQAFLVDLTFAQFVDDAGKVQCRAFTFDGMIDTGLTDRQPTAQALLRDGYVPLTDQTLRDYLRLTSSETLHAANGYIGCATLQDIRRVDTHNPAQDRNTAAFVTGRAFHVFPPGQYTCASTGCARPGLAMLRG